MNEPTTENTGTERCLYCGASIEDMTVLPALNDEDGWADLAEEHLGGCEWIATRAHRVFPDEADRGA